jgi:hypothetical protein
MAARGSVQSCMLVFLLLASMTFLDLYKEYRCDSGVAVRKEVGGFALVLVNSSGL